MQHREDRRVYLTAIGLMSMGSFITLSLLLSKVCDPALKVCANIYKL